MKRFLRWSLGFLALLFLGILALFLSRDLILKHLEERSIYQSTGMRAEIGEFHTALRSPAFVVRDLKLYNLAEFGGTLLARIPELAVELDPAQIAGGLLHFRSLRVNLAELHVVRNETGRYNLDGVEKAVREHIEGRRRRRRDEKPDLEFAGIDQLRFTLRQVRYTDMKHPTRSRAVDLGVTNEVVTTLKTDEDLQYWIGGLVFRILVQQSLQNLGRPAPVDTPTNTTNAPAATPPGQPGQRTNQLR